MNIPEEKLETTEPKYIFSPEAKKNILKLGEILKEIHIQAVAAGIDIEALKSKLPSFDFDGINKSDEQ